MSSRLKTARPVRGLAMSGLVALLLAACTPEKPVTSAASQSAAEALVEQTGFVPPPRSLADVIARVERETRRRDAAAAQRAAAAAEAGSREAQGGPGDAGTDPVAQGPQAEPARRAAEAAARINAALREGRIADALEVSKAASAIAREARLPDLPASLAREAYLESEFGHRRRAVVLYAEASLLAAQSRNAQNRPDRMHLAMSAASDAARNAVSFGDLATAENAVARAKLMRQRAQPGLHAAAWDATLAAAEAELLQARGKSADAERRWREAIAWLNAMEVRRREGLQGSSATAYRGQLVMAHASLARLLNNNWRYAEAETHGRTALSEALDLYGPFHRDVLLAGNAMADIALSQGRYDETRQLSAALLRVGELQTLPPVHPRMRSLRLNLLATDVFSGRFEEAVAGFEAMARDLGANRSTGTDPIFRNRNYAAALIAIGRGAEALPILERDIAQRLRDNGPENFTTRMTQALRGLAQAAAGNQRAALADLDAVRDAVRRGPFGDAASGEALGGWAQSLRRIAISGMIGFYATHPPVAGRDFAAEAFELADVVRSLSVQGAIDSLAQRAGVRDPKLAELVRREQDARQATTALQATYVNLLSLPAAQRDRATEAELASRIAATRATATSLAAEIRTSFPGYEELRQPARPSVESARRRLAADEALVSFFVARDATYAWALRRGGPVGFMRVPMGETARGARP
ncbi:MAG: hypothetical protein ACKOGH_10030, partial [Alphaproteobacteria bacterium]